MTSKWGRQRKAATDAGAMAAQGGEDRRAEFASRGSDLRDAYDAGYRNEQQAMERAFERQNHPLTLISRRAQTLVENSDSEEVREIADILDDITTYLINRESI